MKEVGRLKRNGNVRGEWHAMALLAAFASSAAVADDLDESLRYFSLGRMLNTEPVAMISIGTEAQMVDYAAYAYERVMARNWEVAGRLGCGTHVVDPDDRGRLEKLMVKIYSTHLKHAYYQFEALYGQQGKALLASERTDAGLITDLVRDDLNRCHTRLASHAR